MPFVQGSQNIHQYDRHLEAVVSKYKCNIQGYDHTTINEIEKLVNNENKNTYKILVSQDTLVDDINHISIKELLHHFTQMYKKIANGKDLIDSFKSILNEQLTDMRTGLCPQGRSIRLIQMLEAYDGL
jgi:hypothetical protein